MDWGTCKAIANTKAHLCPRCCLVYDISCQYCRNLRKRVQKGQYLDFKPGLRLTHAIGMFHVHGHQDQCYARYAPRFILGMGLSDGEVMERLFSILNGASTLARTMTLAHRTETLDSHMGDNNFKKMIDMGTSPVLTPWKTSLYQDVVPTLCKKWINVCAIADEFRADYEEMNKSANFHEITLWTKQVEDAEAQRNTTEDAEVMDVYNIKLPRGSSFYNLQKLYLK